MWLVARILHQFPNENKGKEAECTLKIMTILFPNVHLEVD